MEVTRRARNTHIEPTRGQAAGRRRRRPRLRRTDEVVRSGRPRRCRELESSRPERAIVGASTRDRNAGRAPLAPDRRAELRRAVHDSKRPARKQKPSRDACALCAAWSGRVLEFLNVSAKLERVRGGTECVVAGWTVSYFGEQGHPRHVRLPLPHARVRPRAGVFRRRRDDCGQSPRAKKPARESARRVSFAPSRRRRGCHAGICETRLVRTLAATPRLPRGTREARVIRTDAAAATWMFRGDSKSWRQSGAAGGSLYRSRPRP